MTFQLVVMSALSIWTISVALLFNVKTISSGLIFKVVPAILGVIQGVWCLKQWGVF